MTTPPTDELFPLFSRCTSPYGGRVQMIAAAARAWQAHGKARANRKASVAKKRKRKAAQKSRRRNR